MLIRCVPGIGSMRSFSAFRRLTAAELYFSAGPDKGAGGLFGYLKPVATELTVGNDQ